MRHANLYTIQYVRGEFVGGPRDGEWMPLLVPPPERIAIPMRRLVTLAYDVPADTLLDVGSYVRDRDAVCDVVVIADYAILGAQAPRDVLLAAVEGAAPVLYRWVGVA